MDDTIAMDRLVRWGNFHACVFRRATLEIEVCSHSLAQLSGAADPAEVVGGYVIDLFRPDSLDAFERLLRGGDFSATAQCHLAGSDSSAGLMVVALSPPPPGVDPGLLTMICVPRPDHTAALSELHAAVETLTARNAHITELSSLLVHDLRGFVHGIQAGVELLARGRSGIPSRLGTWTSGAHRPRRRRHDQRIGRGRPAAPSRGR